MDILFVSLAIMPALVIVAGLKDLTSMTIPNWISLSIVVAFPVAALVAGLSWTELGLHLAIGLLALFVGMAMFALRFLGGGDAKLMAAVCLWLGVSGSSQFLVWTAIVGGLFALSLIVARSRGQALVPLGPVWFGTLMQPRGDIPYGVAIAIGALIAYPASPLMVAVIG